MAIMSQPIIYIIEPFGGSIRRHNAALPLLYPDDLGVTRGDGIFEAMLVRGGRVHNLERHVQRFVKSAAGMDLPEVHVDKWQYATQAAVEEFGEGEGKVTWTYTRGRSSTGIPSAWVTVEALDPQTLEERANGVKAMTMVRSWTLPQEFDAKTINYAATMAALRMARKQGCADIIYLDTAGHVLEGTRSTVITVKGQKMRTPAATGIVPGTTQQAIFALAEQRGYRCKAKEMDVDYLRGADSVWLVSSTRGPVRVTHLNGEKLPKPADIAAVRQLMEDAVLGS